MNPNTIFNALEAGISDPRLLSWFRSHRNIVANTINAVVYGGPEIVQLQGHLNRLREQWEVAEARMRDKHLKREQAEERLVAARSELERVRAAFQMEQQVFEQLRNQALRSAFSSSAPGMSPEAVASIRAALKPEAPASEADRTRATQAINAFIDRTRRNPAYAAELKSQIEYMRQAIDRAERATEQEMRAEADAQVSLLNVQRTIDYFKGGTEAQKAKNEELRRKVGGTPSGGQLTPEEMKLLRFALHPDRKPGAEELRRASVAFEAYLSGSGTAPKSASGPGAGSRRTTDDWTAEDFRRHAEERKAWDARHDRDVRQEEDLRKAREANQRRQAEREAEERREREQDAARTRHREQNESDAQKRHTRDADQYKRAVWDRAAEGNFRIGDILCASWGYSMTLVDFYYVEGRRGKSTVVLIPLDGTIVDGDGWSGHKVPSEYRKRGPGNSPLTARATVKGDSISVKVNNGARACLWDGKPKYFNTMD